MPKTPKLDIEKIKAETLQTQESETVLKGKEPESIVEITKESLVLPPDAPVESEQSFEAPPASQGQLQITTPEQPGGVWFRETPIKDTAPTPQFTNEEPLMTIVTSGLRCTSGPAVNPADKENRPVTKKPHSAPVSVVDLAEQKLIKDFKPASELPSHLHLLDGSGSEATINNVP